MKRNSTAVTGLFACAISAIAGCPSEPSKKVESAQTTLTSDRQQAVSRAASEVEAAHAQMTEERREFDAKARERLDKADAKAKELKEKSVKLDAKRSVDFKTNYTRYMEQRKDIAGHLSTLDTTSNAEWTKMKGDVESKLDRLDATLDELGQDL